MPPSPDDADPHQGLQPNHIIQKPIKTYKELRKLLRTETGDQGRKIYRLRHIGQNKMNDYNSVPILEVYTDTKAYISSRRKWSTMGHKSVFLALRLEMIT